jgi:hypothetical protein
MSKKGRYKCNISGQVTRKRLKHGAVNQPRLERLKKEFGCYVCGKSDVPGKFLDGHHYYGKASKHKPLSQLCYGPWRKVVDEILGIDRDKGRSGGPVVMICQRYHEDEIKYGEKAKPCTHQCFRDIREPYRVEKRIPGRIRDDADLDPQENSIRRHRAADFKANPQDSCGRFIAELKIRIRNFFNR